MTTKTRNPHYYYFDENKCATENMHTVWYIYDTQYSDFLSRREQVTLEQVKQVTDIYNYLTGEDQRWEQLDLRLKMTYSQYHDSFEHDYEMYDKEYVKYKKGLKNIVK